MKQIVTLLALAAATWAGGEPPFLPAAGTARFDTTVTVTLPETEIIPLDGEWEFSGLENSPVPFPAGEAPENFPAKIRVPLNAFLAEPAKRDRSRPFVRCFYRRKINCSGGSRRAVLEFDAASHHARLYVNGVLAGEDEGSFTPFKVDVTRFLRPGSNEILLEITGDLGPRFGAPEAARRVYGALWAPDNIKIGLWQSARLKLEPEFAFDELRVTPQFREKSIRVDYAIVNPGDARQAGLEARVTSAMKADHAGLNSAKTVQLELKTGMNCGSFTLPLDEPRPWSPETPYLYDLVCRLEKGGAGHARFGFREFRIEEQNFLLNGERIYLFGENIGSVHFGGTGKTAEQTEADLRRYLGGFKSVGCNMIRTAHMPMIPRFYELADEVGLMVYNEHGNCFTRTIDEPEFSRNNLRELEKFVRRDYNHASVVMWAGGNEIPYLDKPGLIRMLDSQVELIRRLDLQKRPAVSFSGNGARHFGTAKLAGDAIDHHSYLGLAIRPWTEWDTELRDDLAVYGKNYGNNLPLIAWELVGFSWGEYRDDSFVPGDADSYFSFTQKPVTWGSPYGIGMAGTLGLAAALDPERGVASGRKIYGKRLLEMVRLNPEIQGFAPWFMDYGQEWAPLWNQPVLPGLRRPGSVIPCNWFCGREYELEFFTVNSTGVPVDDAELILSLGEETLYRLPVERIPAWNCFRKTVRLKAPQTGRDGFRQLRLRLMRNGNELGRNFYEIYLKASPTAAIVPDGEVVLYDAGRVEEASEMLRSFSVAFRRGKEFQGASLVILPPAVREALPQAELESFIRNGGKLLILEQAPGLFPLLAPSALLARRSAFTDLVLTGHPVFDGLEQRNFDTWENPDAGLIVKAAFLPFSRNVVAAAGTHLGQRDFGCAILEGTLGKGRIFASQLEALACYREDSAAAAYLENLLRYMCSGPAYEKIKPLIRPGDDDYKVRSSRMKSIDLAPFANRSTNGESGWTGQGNNDLRMLPHGRQTFAGIPFDIAGPGRSVLMLRGSERPDYPGAVRNIPLNGCFSRLFFLTGCAWGNGREAGRLRMHYADGTSADLVLRDGRNTGDWYNHVALPEAKPGFRHPAGSSRNVGLYVTEWVNPHPEKRLTHFDFLAAGIGTREVDFIPAASPVPILAGASGEEYGKVRPLPADLGKLVSTVWQDGEKAEVKGKLLMIPAPTPAGGYSAVKLKLDGAIDSLRSGDYAAIVLELRARTPGYIDLVWPDREWKRKFGFTLDLSERQGEWRTIRLPLGEEIPATELRDEIFLYNCNINARLPRTPVRFEIRKLFFE